MSMIPMGDSSDKRVQFEALGYGKAERPTRAADEYTYAEEPALAVQVLRKFAAVLTGVAAYLVTYGMLLTFGLLAVLALTLGFATLPSPMSILDGASGGTTYATTPTPRASAATPAKSSAAQPGDLIRSLIRIIAFGAGFLAIWPAWFVGSLAWRHYQQ